MALCTEFQQVLVHWWTIVNLYGCLAAITLLYMYMPLQLDCESPLQFLKSQAIDQPHRLVFVPQIHRPFYTSSPEFASDPDSAKVYDQLD